MKNEAMMMAIERARETMNKNFGGPFGAAIVDANGEIVVVSSDNIVLFPVVILRIIQSISSTKI